MEKRKAKTSTKRPMKQHMSPMAYAVFSAVFLIIGIGLLLLNVEPVNTWNFKSFLIRTTEERTK